MTQAFTNPCVAAARPRALRARAWPLGVIGLGLKLPVPQKRPLVPQFRPSTVTSDVLEWGVLLGRFKDKRRNHRPEHSDSMSPLPDLGLAKSVLDPIHGLIRLTSEECRVIDHPLFSRLRAIKQNGLLYLVFPSATHTRFEHSLGALYVADAMLEALLLNSYVAVRKKNVADFKRAAVGQAVDLGSVEQRDWTGIRRLTRLAALVHDMGHGPFSHTFDKFAPRVRTLRKILADPRLATVRGLEEVLTTWHVEPGETLAEEDRIPHEVMSCVFFAFVWGRDAEPEIPVAVTAAVLGPKAFAQVRNPLHRQWVGLINDIIASAPADADRMDYLERDSRSIGVSYGLFDRNRLLKTLLCYLASNGPENTYRLGLKKSGLRAVENIVQARFEMFVQIYYHKTNRAIQLMLAEIASLAKANGKDEIIQDDLDGLVARYIELTDEYFLRLLRGKEPGPLAGFAPINDLAEAIQNRSLWKRVADCQSEKEAKAWESTLAREKPEAKIRLDTLDPEATKDLEKGAAMLRRGEDGIYSAHPAEAWSTGSKIIETLKEEERAIARIYLLECNSQRATELRDFGRSRVAGEG